MTNWVFSYVFIYFGNTLDTYETFRSSSVNPLLKHVFERQNYLLGIAIAILYPSRIEFVALGTLLGQF